MGNYNYQYQKARKEWKASLGPRPVCWLCLEVIDLELHHYNRLSFELDHMYPVSEYPHLANDPQFFRPSHKKCNASRKAHGWTADEFRSHSATLKTTPVVDTSMILMHNNNHVAFDDDDDDVAYPIGVVRPARARSAVPAVPVIPEDAPTLKPKPEFHNKVSSVIADPRPPIYSRDWDCDHNNSMPTKKCTRCMAYRADRIRLVHEWKERQPALA